MRVKIKPFEKANLTHNAIVLRVDYDKRKTGPVLHMSAMEVADGFQKCALMASPSGEYVIETGWKTNNKKRLAAAEDLVAHQIAKKEGDVWDALQEFAKAAGTEILDEVAVAA